MKSRKDASEGTAHCAQVAFDGPSYGGSLNGRANDTVECRQLHKIYDSLRLNSHSENLTQGSVSGYGNASACDSFRNANSKGLDWYTPDVGRSSSPVVERRSPSIFFGRRPTPARAVTRQHVNPAEEEKEDDANTQLRSTPSRHILYQTSATTALSLKTTRQSTMVRILIIIILQ